jgi:hypothetical protein
MKMAEYVLTPAGDLIQLGMIVLQSDVTIEDEFRFYFADAKVSLLVNRILSKTRSLLKRWRVWRTTSSKPLRCSH